MLGKKHKKGYVRYLAGKTEFNIWESEQDGMLYDCAINCDHIQTVSKSKIGALITTVSKEKLDEIRNAISFALNL